MITEINLAEHYLKINDIKVQFGEGTAEAIKNAIDTKANNNHEHGQIKNDGSIGNTPNLPLITGSNGKIITGKFGSNTSRDATEFVSCNDIRLRDARTPINHDHGDIKHNGTITSTDITNINKILVTNSDSQIKTTTNIPYSNISGRPVNVSDLTNDAQYTTATTHGHGKLTSNGKLTANTSNINKIVVTDSNSELKTINQLPYSIINDPPFIPKTTDDLTNTSGFTTAEGHNHDSQYVRLGKHSYVNGVLSDNLILRTMTFVSIERTAGTQPIYLMKIKINDFDPSKENPIVEGGTIVNKNVDYTNNIWSFTILTNSNITITIPQYEDKSMATITVESA